MVRSGFIKNARSGFIAESYAALRTENLVVGGVIDVGHVVFVVSFSVSTLEINSTVEDATMQLSAGVPKGPKSPPNESS